MMELFPFTDKLKFSEQKGVPIPVAAKSKAWVCGRWLAGISDSNHAGGMDVCLLQMFFVVR